MTRSVRQAWACVLTVLLLVSALLMACDAGRGGPEPVSRGAPLATPLAGADVTSLSGLDVDTASGGTYDALSVSQHGTGDIAVFYDGATAVVTIDDSGLAVTTLISQAVTCEIADDIVVADDATVGGDLVANTTAVTETLTAADLVASDDLTVADDASITGTLTVGDLTVGGGYGTTGCSISAAGVLQCDGAGTLASLTAPALTVNGTGITMDSMVFTYTAPITITGVLTNVRLLYYQVE